MKTRLVKGFLTSLFLLTLFSLNANAQPNYVYTNNDPNGPNSVTAFSVAANGALTQVPGSPFLTGGNGLGGGFFGAVHINVTLVGSFLYVTNDGSNNISAFTINPATGALTTVPGSPFSTGVSSGHLGISLAVTPDNRFLYAANIGSSNISIFSIAANGALMAIPGSPFPLGAPPDGTKMSPDGKFLAIAFFFMDAVGIYAINPDGTLTAAPGSPFVSPAFGAAAGLDINCAGTLLYVGQTVLPGTAVDGFNIAANGSVTSVPGSPFYFPAVGGNSNNVLLSNDDKFLFVSNNSNASVTVFNVAANGSLSLVPGSPFPAGGGVETCGMATNQAGNLLYVANLDTSTVTVFNIAANGTLTSVPGSPFSTGQPNSSGLISLTAFPSKSCSSYDFCIQDDANGNLLKFNSNTGAYTFMNCRKGFTLTGTGKVVKQVNNGFCKIELSDRGPDPKRPDRDVSTFVNPCTGKGNAQVTIARQTVTISDSNIYNNTCVCP
jgi:3-carboxymuconate cyclase